MNFQVLELVAIYWN